MPAPNRSPLLGSSANCDFLLTHERTVESRLTTLEKAVQEIQRNVQEIQRNVQEIRRDVDRVLCGLHTNKKVMWFQLEHNAKVQSEIAKINKEIQKLARKVSVSQPGRNSIKMITDL
jgi:chromosome segregation ATPase